jgi:hypothetical protein
MVLGRDFHWRVVRTELIFARDTTPWYFCRFDFDSHHFNHWLCFIQFRNRNREPGGGHRPGRKSSRRHLDAQCHQRCSERRGWLVILFLFPRIRVMAVERRELSATRTRPPLAIGWQAARANAVPTLILQTIMLGLLIGYYVNPGIASELRPVRDFTCDSCVSGRTSGGVNRTTRRCAYNRY